MAVRSTRRTLLLSLVYFVPLAATFVLFPEFYTKLFWSPDSAFSLEALSGLTTKLLALVAAWGIFDAVSLMFSGALRGAGDTKFVVVVSGLLAWLFWIPGVVYLYRFRQAGIVTLWTFTSIYVALLALVFFLRFKTGKWKHIDLLGRNEAEAA